MSKVKEKQQRKRSEIIEACIPFIGTKPFDDISIADICNASGISVGSFYHYFTKKSDILVGLLGLIDEYLEEKVFPLLNSEDDGENLRILAHEWAVYVEAHGIERSKLISSVEPADEDQDGTVRAAWKVIHSIMERGLGAGIFLDSYSAEKLTSLYLLTLRGVTTDWSRRNAGFSLVQCMDETADIFIRGISRA